MRRRLLLILLLLVGGATVNVAVAWGSGYRTPLPRGLARDALLPDEAGKLWQMYGTGPSPETSLPKGWREHRAFRDTIWVGTSLMSTSTGGFNGFAVAPTVSDALIVESGVPFRSLRYVDSNVVSTMPTMPAPPGRAPPVKWLRQATPVWPGFAINSVFYAFVLWLLVIATIALRQRRRIKRGLCPKCAYDLRNRPSDSSVCPECGAATKHPHPSPLPH